MKLEGLLANFPQKIVYKDRNILINCDATKNYLDCKRLKDYEMSKFIIDPLIGLREDIKNNTNIDDSIMETEGFINTSETLLSYGFYIPKYKIVKSETNDKKLYIFKLTGEDCLFSKTMFFKKEGSFWVAKTKKQNFGDCESLEDVVKLYLPYNLNGRFSIVNLDSVDESLRNKIVGELKKEKIEPYFDFSAENYLIKNLDNNNEHYFLYVGAAKVEGILKPTKIFAKYEKE